MCQKNTVGSGNTIKATLSSVEVECTVSCSTIEIAAPMRTTVEYLKTGTGTNLAIRRLFGNLCANGFGRSGEK